ncbi:hypothetical protein PENSPDRAFT_374864 [Peniophora sp. CONT]|nr:hypothetical protein PENSPDRAFT_374864 [Peniophora sp. CONT]
MRFFCSTKKATIAPAAQAPTSLKRTATKRRLVRAESTFLNMPGAYPKTRQPTTIKRDASFTVKTLAGEATMRDCCVRADIIRGKAASEAKLVKMLFAERKRVLRGIEYAKKVMNGGERAEITARYKEEFAKATATPEGAEEFRKKAEASFNKLLEETRRKKEILRAQARAAKAEGKKGYSYLSVEDMMVDSIDGVPLADSEGVDSFFFDAATPTVEDAARAERIAERERACAEAERQHREELEEKERQAYIQAQRERNERMNREAAERMEALKKREAEEALLSEESLAAWRIQCEIEKEQEKRRMAEAQRAMEASIEKNLAYIRGVIAQVAEDRKRREAQRLADEADAAFAEGQRRLAQQQAEEARMTEEKRKADEKRRAQEVVESAKRRLQEALARVRAQRAAEERANAEKAAQAVRAAANYEAFERAASIAKSSTNADEVASALYDMSMYSASEPDAVLREYAVYDWKWASLKANALLPGSWDADMLPWPLAFDDIPLLNRMDEDGITEVIEAAIVKFVLNKARRGFEDMSDRKRIHKELLHWHPDKFEASYLPVVPFDQREVVTKAVHLVSSTLTGLLSKSNVQ